MNLSFTRKGVWRFDTMCSISSLLTSMEYMYLMWYLTRLKENHLFACKFVSVCVHVFTCTCVFACFLFACMNMHASHVHIYACTYMCLHTETCLTMYIHSDLYICKYRTCGLVCMCAN